MRTLIVVTIITAGLSACSSDPDRYGATYVDEPTYLDQLTNIDQPRAEAQH
ncbi:MAG: hypothetical protein AAF862_06575 [Pseudomonadota bacterium]